MIEIYGKTQCPFCDRAKALCEQKGYEYTYKQLGEDFDREFYVRKVSYCKNFPQIVAHGERLVVSELEIFTRL